MSDAPNLVLAGAGLPDWLEWVLILVFFVGPTVIGWLRKLAQGAATSPEGTPAPAPNPQKASPAKAKPSGASARQASRKETRREARERQIPTSSRPAARSGAQRPVQRTKPATAAASSRMQRTERPKPSWQRRTAAAELAEQEEALRREEQREETSVRTRLSVGSLSGREALASMLSPLAQVPALREVLGQPDVLRSLQDRLSSISAPWRLVGAFQVAGVASVARVPGLRQEVYQAAGLPEDGLQITSLQELARNPELLAAAWVEILFADALGLAVAGPAWARARVAGLVASGAVSDMRWDARARTMVINPPARIVAPVLAHVLRQGSEIKEAQAVEALAGEASAAPLSLHVLGLGQTFSMELPEEALVIESQQMLQRMMGTAFMSLNSFRPADRMGENWEAMGPSVRRWVERLRGRSVESAPSLESSFGLFYACSLWGTDAVETLLASADVRQSAPGTRGGAGAQKVGPGLGAIPGAQAMVESMLVGSLLASPASRRHERRSQSLL